MNTLHGVRFIQPFTWMIYASCCKVNIDKVVDYGKFWQAILLVRTPPYEMDLATMGGPKEQCVSLK